MTAAMTTCSTTNPVSAIAIAMLVMMAAIASVSAAAAMLWMAIAINGLDRTRRES